MSDKIRSLFDPFDPDACTDCGECFHRCPVMRLPLDVAQAEMKRLRRGEVSRHVLRRCTTCLACNLICEEQANPCQLVIERYHEQYRERGFPIRARYFQPHSRPNFRTYVIDRLPDDEKQFLASWADTSPCEEIFYPGCNFCTAPYLTQTSLLADFDIRGGLDYCCGEAYYRTGLYESLVQAGRRLEKWFEELGVGRVIMPCTAGYNMFTNVLPRFGIDLGLEITPLLAWLWDRLEQGQIEVRNKVEMVVTIQDSCYGKIFGSEYLDLPRKILRSVGADVVETQYCREDSLCCGIGGGFPNVSGYHPLDMTLSTFRCLRQAQRTGAEAIVVYCAGCLQMLSTGRLLYPTRRPIYHIIEVVQMAIGEKPVHRNMQRARQFLTGMMRHQFPTLLSRNRLWMEEIIE